MGAAGPSQLIPSLVRTAHAVAHSTAPPREQRSCFSSRSGLRGSDKRRGCSNAGPRPLFPSAPSQTRGGAGTAEIWGRQRPRHAARGEPPPTPSYAAYPSGLPGRQPLPAPRRLPGRPPGPQRPPPAAPQGPLGGLRGSLRAAPVAAAPSGARPAELLAAGRAGKLRAAACGGCGSPRSSGARRAARGGTALRPGKQEGTEPQGSGGCPQGLPAWEERGMLRGETSAAGP